MQQHDDFTSTLAAGGKWYLLETGDVRQLTEPQAGAEPLTDAEAFRELTRSLVPRATMRSELAIALTESLVEDLWGGSWS